MQPKNSIRSERIYILRDPITSEVRYVGKTSSYSTDRLSKHTRDARAGKRYYVSRWIRTLLIRGVAPIMEVIEVIPEGGDWQAAEKKWIAHYRSLGAILCNLTDGGEGNVGWKMPEAMKAHLAEKGRNISDETRAKRSASLKGRVISQSQRDHYRKLYTGRKNAPCSEERKAKIGAANKGNQVNRGRKASPDARANMSVAQLKVRGEFSRRLISDDQAREIRERYYATEVTQDELAAEFGVSWSVIYRIRRGLLRPDAGGPIRPPIVKKKQIKCRKKGIQGLLFSTAKTS